MTKAIFDKDSVFFYFANHEWVSQKNYSRILNSEPVRDESQKESIIQNAYELFSGQERKELETIEDFTDKIVVTVFDECRYYIINFRKRNFGLTLAIKCEGFDAAPRGPYALKNCKVLPKKAEVLNNIITFS